MIDARAEILARIRTQLGLFESLHSEQRARGAAGAYASLERHYTQRGGEESEARIALLLERLADYEAEVIELEEAGIAGAVAWVLSRSAASILLVPAAIPLAWVPEGATVWRDAEDPGDALPTEMLTQAHAVLTACAGAIAETGTLLLEHGLDRSSMQGRRVLTLLPDHHICVLRAEMVVETVSEGLAMLRGVECSAMTTISGPSATADIEMTRIRGVHGPRRLTVLLVR